MKTITSISTGVGLKPIHFETIISSKPALGFFEIHPENYFVSGGAMHHYLEKIAQDYPLSFHGVGMSLGSSDGIDEAHLKKFKALIDRYNPSLISEHVAWSRFGVHSLNDLLPIPYTDESLIILIDNIDKAQNSLGRQLLIENPSTYIECNASTYSEIDFIKTLLKQTGAKLLLDVNNVYVCSINHGFNAKHYLNAVTPDSVGEIHLAGHSVEFLANERICIDDHSSTVSADVWALYELTLTHIGAKPTLIEWDGNIPEWDILFQQAQQAHRHLNNLAKVVA